MIDASQNELLKRLDVLLNGNPNDILLITNPDIACDEIDSVDGWAHKDYFEVKWDSRPHRIVPGQTRRMPRWLAKHFAKYVADHLLTKENKPTNDARRRPEILLTILLSVDEKFEEEEIKREGEVVQQEVDKLNEPAPSAPVDPMTGAVGGGKSMNLPEQGVGTVADPVLGTLRSKSDLTSIMEAEKSPKPEAPYSTIDPDKPRPTKSQLITEAVKLGLEVNGSESVDQLIAKIKAF